MKYLLLLSLTVGAQASFAESLKEKKIKEEMLQRTESLIQRSQEGRDALDEENAALACHKIKEIFTLLPKHLLAIGTRMDLFDKDIIKLEKETRVFLIQTHRLNNTCETGENGENLDIEGTDRQLKAMNKAFKKQKKTIKKNDTNYDNTYNYYYQF